MNQESLQAADAIIFALKNKGIHCADSRDEIAQQLFEDGIFSGNWDCSMEIGDMTLRAIQEDEFDQHMDESEDKPQSKKLCFAGSAYIWINE